MRHLGMSWNEISSLPVRYRRWVLERYIKDLEEKSSAQKSSNNQIVQEAPSLRQIDDFTSNMMKKFSK
jgi:hypothetical protein